MRMTLSEWWYRWRKVRNVWDCEAAHRIIYRICFNFFSIRGLWSNTRKPIWNHNEYGIRCQVSATSQQVDFTIECSLRCCSRNHWDVDQITTPPDKTAIYRQVLEFHVEKTFFENKFTYFWLKMLSTAHKGWQLWLEFIYLYAVGFLMWLHWLGLRGTDGTSGLGVFVGLVRGVSVPPPSFGKSIHIVCPVFFSGNTEQSRAGGQGKPIVCRTGWQRC